MSISKVYGKRVGENVNNQKPSEAVSRRDRKFVSRHILKYIKVITVRANDL